MLIYTCNSELFEVYYELLVFTIFNIYIYATILVDKLYKPSEFSRKNRENISKIYAWNVHGIMLLKPFFYSSEYLDSLLRYKDSKSL